MKYLLLAALLAVAWAMWRHQRRSPPPAATRRPPPALPVDQMVACAHCGTHVPQSEALMDGPHAYCSPQHLQRGPA